MWRFICKTRFTIKLTQFKCDIYLKRFESSQVKYSATLNRDVEEEFNSGVRHRLHCGRRNVSCVSLPYQLELAAVKLVNKYNSAKFKDDVKNMYFHAHLNQLPVEDTVIRERTKEVTHLFEVRKGVDIKHLPDHQKEEMLNKLKNKTFDKLNNIVYDWKELKYDDYLAAVYMTARLPANYAALHAVFLEIKKSDPNFIPTTLFDFGSGVGTTIWAANYLWPKTINEFFCVDISADMNDFSRLLLQGGNENKKMLIDTVFHRQFLPASHNIKYDMVVSAFSLLEIPDAKNRVHVIENLWHKTQDMLIIVEHGTTHGFAAVLEARNLILEMTGYKLTKRYKENLETHLSVDNASVGSHILAPCPHHYSCPRQFGTGPLLCNFEVSYNPLNYGQENFCVLKEAYSYVVLRKGPKQDESESSSWPRVVQPVLRGHHRAVCRMCCSDGQIHEIVFTPSRHDKQMYRCAKISKWGDKLPVKVFPLHN